jgi:hypothetical protein
MISTRRANRIRIQIWNQTQQGELGQQILLADTFWARARGLLG